MIWENYDDHENGYGMKRKKTTILRTQFYDNAIA